MTAAALLFILTELFGSAHFARYCLAEYDVDLGVLIMWFSLGMGCFFSGLPKKPIIFTDNPI
jgi:hypothetical protein